MIPPTGKPVGFLATDFMTKKAIIAVLRSVGLATTGTSIHYEHKLTNQKVVLNDTINKQNEEIETLNNSLEDLQKELDSMKDTIKAQRQELLELKEPKPVQLSSKKVNMELTYYVATGNPTASGKMPKAGRTCASNRFSLGTHLLIDGKEYIVEDRGGALGNSVIDIFVDSYEEAVRLGRRKAVVEVL